MTKQITTVPTSVTDKVAGGGVEKSLFIPSSQLSAASAGGTSYFSTVNGTALTASGKPEVLFVGANYCPFCAAQRWAMVNALSRFGTFTGLTTTHSSSTDSYPNTPTYTFYRSTYTSNYITFTPVEETSNEPDGNGGYKTLQTPTSAQQALLQAYDPGTGQGGAIPFLDLGQQVRPGWQPHATQPVAALRQDLGPGRGRHERPDVRHCQGRARQRQLHDRRHLQADEQPACDGLHADHPEAPG